jgi:hypothetical protein
MKVKALRQHPYAGKIHKRGAIYEMGSGKDLNLLSAIGVVQIISDEEQEKAEIVYKLKEAPVKVMGSHKAVKQSSEKNPSKKAEKNTYSRRDMRANHSADSLVVKEDGEDKEE